jgi:hypothetical protein
MRLGERKACASKHNHRRALRKNVTQKRRIVSKTACRKWERGRSCGTREEKRRTGGGLGLGGGGGEKEQEWGNRKERTDVQTIEGRARLCIVKRDTRQR